MTTRFDVMRGLEPLITAAVDMLAAERHLPAGSAVREHEERAAALVQQVHVVADLVDGLEPGEMPKSWRRPDGARRPA